MNAPEDTPVQIVALSGNAQVFSLMTFTPLQPLLENVGDAVGALGAYRAGDPCGLLLYQRGDNGAVQLLSVYVTKDVRRRGYARALMRAFYDAVGDRPVWTRWSSQLPAIAALEGLLRTTGWSDKETSVVEVATTPRRVIDYANSRPHWRMVDRVGSYHWTLWSERSAEDEEVIRALSRREDCPDVLNPYVYSAAHEIWPVNSMVLRLKGTPVGWILTRHLGDFVLYDCNYVRPDLGRMGAIIPMMVDMFRRQGEAIGLDSPVRYFINAQTPAMLKIVQGSLGGAHSCSEHFDAVRHPARRNDAATA